MADETHVAVVDSGADEESNAGVLDRLQKSDIICISVSTDTHTIVTAADRPSTTRRQTIHTWQWPMQRRRWCQ